MLQNIQKVVEAPPDAQIFVASEVRKSDSPDAIPVRLTDDPSAPIAFKAQPDVTHPYRMTEVIVEANKQLPAEHQINSHDIISVRKVHGIEDNETFYYDPKHYSGLYSPEFVSWLLEQYEANDNFFKEARNQYREILRGNLPTNSVPDWVSE